MTRRTGKAGGSAGSEQSTTVQQQMQLKAEEAGLILADNFQAQMLMSAMVAIQSGYSGDRTKQLLDILNGQTDSPLAIWGEQLTWENSSQLPLLSESNGLSS